MGAVLSQSSPDRETRHSQAVLNRIEPACVVLATASREAAYRDATRAGFNPLFVVSKVECEQELAEIRRRAHERGAQALLVHTGRWSREPLPHFYELTALRLALPACHVIEPGGAIRQSLTRSDLAIRVGSIPVDAAKGLSLVAVEAARLAHACRVHRTHVRGHLREGWPVLALWPLADSSRQVGGAVTHLSGMLGAFRRAGLKVILVAASEPPAQLSDAIDDFVGTAPLARSARITGEITAVAANRASRRLIESELANVDPAFIYQRYDMFQTCGVEMAQRWGTPAVVEWNVSAVWERNNWRRRPRFGHLLAPLLEDCERFVASRGDIVVAVSSRAAEMAIDAGASPQRVLTIPNGVNLEDVDAARALARPRANGSLIGWVGSFGVWHGAHVLVEAMQFLRGSVRAMMVGDGNERESCEQLARKLGVWERIEWTGELPHAEAIRRLSECDVLVSPHVPPDGGQPFFGSPTKLFEYMAIGRPIVASALEQLAEVLRDGQTARLVTPGDPTELADGIRGVLEDPDHALRLAAAARSEAEALHTWDARATTILERLSGADR